MKDRKSHAYDSHGVSATELRERLDRAEMQLATLREVLKPFAILGRMVPDLNNSYGEILYAWCLKSGDYELTKKMLVDAGQALKDN